MDNMHYNLALHRNKSLAHGIPMWNYVWLSSNGRGHGAGFYRWQLWASVAYGTKGLMQWSISPCGNIHACGPRDRWAPYPCLLDKHGAPFKPVYNMAKAEHDKLVVLGPLLLSLTSQSVLRLAPSRTTPIVELQGMPLKSISSGAWVIGHLNRTAGLTQGAGAGFNDCVAVVNDDPINTGFPSIDLGPQGALVAREVDQATGELVSVTGPVITRHAPAPANTPWVVGHSISVANLHVRCTPMGGASCVQTSERNSTITPRSVYVPARLQGCGGERRAGTPREPFNATPMGATSISPARLHVRPTGRTCR